MLITNARAGRADCVKLLLEAAADVQKRDWFEGTALIASARGGFSDCVKLLLEAASDINATNIFGTNALLAAAESSDIY